MFTAVYLGLTTALVSSFFFTVTVSTRECPPFASSLLKLQNPSLPKWFYCSNSILEFPLSEFKCLESQLLLVGYTIQ
jgi:hypothetical protein